ncbi:MAG: 50S ribosomal protein L7/L12 [Patescibacteria group bacterium]
MAEEQTVELNDKLQKIAEQIEGLTVVELADLAKYLEEKFGVSGMPMVAAGAMPAGGAGGAAEEPGEEKTEFTVELAEAGGNKLAVIKVVRELVPSLGLMDAKKLVEAAPKPILENAKKEAAEEAKKKLEDAGAKVNLK